MRRNKPGLGDLKKLRQLVQAPEPAPTPPARPQRVARQRSPFLMPGNATKGGAEQAAAGDQRAAGTPHDPRSRSVVAPRDSRPRPVAGPARSAATQAPQAPYSESLLSEADRRLFRSAVRYVEKLPDPGRALLPPVPTAPAAILKDRRLRAAGVEPLGLKKHAASTAANADANQPPPASALSDAYAPAHADDRVYLRPGHGTDVIANLKQGKWPIGASLDLHGSNVEEARERFERFLASCLAHDIRCVRIVHGKGYGSKDGDAVLKTTVRRWLTQVTDVIAYTECNPADGGAGAVQVLLAGGQGQG